MAATKKNSKTGYLKNYPTLVMLPIDLEDWTVLKKYLAYSLKKKLSKKWHYMIDDMVIYSKYKGKNGVEQQSQVIFLTNNSKKEKK